MSQSNTSSVQHQSFQDRNDPLLKRLAHRAMHALDGVFGSFSTVGDKPVHDPSIFPRTKRPMRQPLAGLNDLLLNLLRYTPAVQNARENPKQWSEHLERAEPETSELPVEAGWVPRPHFQCRA